MRKKPKKHNTLHHRVTGVDRNRAEGPAKTEGQALENLERRQLWTKIYILRAMTGMALIFAVVLGFFVSKAGRDLDSYFFHLNWVQRMQLRLMAENETALAASEKVIVLFEGLGRCQCEGEPGYLDLVYNQFLDLVEVQMAEKRQTEALLREFETQKALRKGDEPPPGAQGASVSAAISKPDGGK